ncbi:MAG: hypothetical protein AAF483_06535 [Planctomycetota bacterium]
MSRSLSFGCVCAALCQTHFALPAIMASVGRCTLPLAALWIAQLCTPIAAQNKHSSLEFSKWSAAINVPDPVAISVDDQGRVFVTQTRRRKIQDLDIRQHREWIPNDLSFTSVEQKSAFYRSQLAIDGDSKKQAKHVKDWNEDGKHDWRDLTVVSEAVYRLDDMDQDGKADEITTFAEDFKTEVTGVAAGVLAYDGTVYATVAPDVWRLQDQDQDGVSESRSVMATGFGLHIAYGGHDMHGLTIGPDGKIYWSIGDKGIHVETKDGQVFSYPHEGGVMRCNPDGSDFEVFAHGLRNVQEIAFDQYGNMFGVDNDADQPGEKERFVYIVNQMDAGWRCYYQYRGGDYNPWTSEKLWQTAGENHPAYIVPPIRHYIDGPAGFKFNPGTALSEDYRNYFFLTGAPNGNQYAFRVEPQGDSFQMLDEHQFGKGIAIVGLAFGPDGALYGADWDGGYPLDEKGSVIRIDVSKDQQDAQRGEVQNLLKVGLAQTTNPQLLELLSHADQRIRLKAQFALVERAQTPALAELVRNRTADQMARLHAIWGLGQLGRRGDTLARDSLGLVLKSSDPILRAQAAKTYGELPAVRTEPLLSMLGDQDLHVRTLAALAIARHPDKKASDELFKQCDALGAQQHYLRHGLATALAACVESSQLKEQISHASEMRRLCCVLALRKQKSADVAIYLTDQSKWVATEAARAIHDGDSIPEALPALCKSLETLAKTDDPDDAFYRRAINAGFRIGTNEQANFLVQLLGATEVDVNVKLEIMDALNQWTSPSPLDRVEGIFRHELSATSRPLALNELPSVLLSLVKTGESKLRQKSLELIKRLQTGYEQEDLLNLIRDTELDSITRNLAFDIAWGEDKSIFDLAIESESDLLQLHAVKAALMDGKDQEKIAKSVERIESLLGKEDIEKPLVRQTLQVVQLFPGECGTPIVANFMSSLDRNQDAELLLDASEAVAALAESRPEFKSVQETFKDEFGADAFQFADAGGDSAIGEKLFRTHGQAQCARCHRVGKEGSDIGPELNGIADKRDNRHLLEALIDPSAAMEEKYRSQSILLDSDEVILGRIQDEKGEVTRIANSKGEILEIPSDEIVAVKEQKTSLMPRMTDVLSPREVRDIIAYLQSLK